jgi:hypothetical protein
MFQSSGLACRILSERAKPQIFLNVSHGTLSVESARFAENILQGAPNQDRILDPVLDGHCAISLKTR